MTSCLPISAYLELVNKQKRGTDYASTSKA